MKWKTQMGVAIVSVLALVAGIGAMPSLAGADDSAVAKVKPSAAPRPAPLNPDPVQRAAVELDQQLQAAFPNSYAGLEISHDQLGVIVHVVDSGRADLEAFATRTIDALRAQGWSLEHADFVRAEVSLGDLKKGVESLKASIDVLREEGVTVTSFGVGVQSNHVEATVEHLSGDAEQKISAVVRTRAQISERGFAQAASRLADSPPWYGGDRIATSSSSCTSGFSFMNSSGGTVNSTAGHCDGTSSHNATFAQNGGGYGVTVAWSRCSGCAGDAELISTYPNSADGFVWQTNSSYAPVSAVETQTQFPGTLMCTDASFTNQVCQATITNSNSCVLFSDGVTTCGLVAATKVGSTISQPGDSGGPVYNRNANGSVTARGLITGTPCTGACDTVFYTQVAFPMFVFSVSVVTH